MADGVLKRVGLGFEPEGIGPPVIEEPFGVLESEGEVHAGRCVCLLCLVGEITGELGSASVGSKGNKVDEGFVEGSVGPGLVESKGEVETEAGLRLIEVPPEIFVGVGSMGIVEESVGLVESKGEVQVGLEASRVRLRFEVTVPPGVGFVIEGFAGIVNATEGPVEGSVGLIESEREVRVGLEAMRDGLCVIELSPEISVGVGFVRIEGFMGSEGSVDGSVGVVVESKGEVQGGFGEVRVSFILVGLPAEIAVGVGSVGIERFIGIEGSEEESVGLLKFKEVGVGPGVRVCLRVVETSAVPVVGFKKVSVGVIESGGEVQLT